MSEARAEKREELKPCPTCQGNGTVPDYVGLEMRCVEAECPECKVTGHKRGETKEAAMTPAEKEQYVRKRWDRVSVGHYALTTYPCYFCVCAFNPEEIRLAKCPPFHFKSEPEAWSAAYAFTKERERQIAEVREEISLLEGWRFVQENNPAALRIFARECAALAELQCGMKKDQP